MNRESLNLIETCIFVICLDDSIPLSFNHQTSIDETNTGFRDDVSMATQMLHGFGTKVNSCNRWFDKTMQVSPIPRLHKKIRRICQLNTPYTCYVSASQIIVIRKRVGRKTYNSMKLPHLFLLCTFDERTQNLILLI